MVCNIFPHSFHVSLLPPPLVSSLNEALSLLKEQSKAKMVAAIEKMKELKASFNSKSEECSAGNIRITELEQNLLLSSQDVLKYKGAMEKALPKFRDLKIELDEKTKIAEELEIVNATLKERVSQLEVMQQMVMGQSESQQPEKQEEKEEDSKGENSSPLTAETQLIDVDLLTTHIDSGISVDTVPNIPLHTVSDSTVSASDDLIHGYELQLSNRQDTIDELTAVITGLQGECEEARMQATQSEEDLRAEIQVLLKVRTYPRAHSTTRCT